VREISSASGAHLSERFRSNGYEWFSCLILHTKFVFLVIGIVIERRKRKETPKKQQQHRIQGSSLLLYDLFVLCCNGPATMSRQKVHKFALFLFSFHPRTRYSTESNTNLPGQSGYSTNEIWIKYSSAISHHIFALNQAHC